MQIRRQRSYTRSKKLACLITHMYTCMRIQYKSGYQQHFHKCLFISLRSPTTMLNSHKYAQLSDINAVTLIITSSLSL